MTESAFAFAARTGVDPGHAERVNITAGINLNDDISQRGIQKLTPSGNLRATVGRKWIDASRTDLSFSFEGDNDTGIRSPGSNQICLVAGNVDQICASTTGVVIDGSLTVNGAFGFGGDLDMGGNRIINLGDPIDPTDGVNKQYVDSAASGLFVKQACDLTTTTILDNVGNGVWTAAGSGVGKTLTAGAAGTTTIDGVIVSDGDRILVKNEDGTGVNLTAADNGIYTASNSGAGTATVLTRATDFDQNSDVQSGTFTLILDGSTCTGCGYVLVTPDPIVIDTTDLEFVQFSFQPSGFTTNSNTALGLSALSSVTSGSGNVGIGYQAGDTITTETNNTIIGHTADVGATTDNATVIGYASTATGDNSAAIGANVSVTTANQMLIGDSATTLRLGGTNAGSGASDGNGYDRVNGILQTTADGQLFSSYTLAGTLIFTGVTDFQNNISLGNDAGDTITIDAGTTTYTNNHAVTLNDNSATSYTIGSTGATNLIAINTTDGSESVTINGTFTPNTFAPSTETIAVTGGGANVDPDNGVMTTFITTSGVGDANGELQNGTVDGQLKILVAVGLTATANYVLDVSTDTNLIDAGGVTATSMRFNDNGESAHLIWRSANSTWYIVGSGVTII